MAAVYRPRHPERTVLYRVLFHYFDHFLTEYESRFEKEFGFFRPIDKEVVERYLDCSNPRCGFARIRCPACQAEGLVMFSCRTRRFCPSYHAKRLEEWGEWMRGGWAEMMDWGHVLNSQEFGMCPHFYELLLGPRCGATMKIISFLTDYAVVDRIISHLKLTFVAERPPSAHLVVRLVNNVHKKSEPGRNTTAAELEGDGVGSLRGSAE